MSAITQPLRSLKETEASMINSVVVIKIAPESLTKCLDYFLSQQFAFEVQFKREENLHKREELNVVHETTAPIFEINNGKENVAKKIYNKYINEITEVPMPGMSEIAAEFGVSVNKLKVLFLEEYGQPMYKAYMQSRMMKSAELLGRGYKASVVSKMVGYGDKSGIKLNKMFQKHFGITPKKYQIKMSEKVC